MDEQKEKEVEEKTTKESETSQEKTADVDSDSGEKPEGKTEGLDPIKVNETMKAMEEKMDKLNQTIEDQKSKIAELEISGRGLANVTPEKKKVSDQDYAQGLLEGKDLRK